MEAVLLAFLAASAPFWMTGAAERPDQPTGLTFETIRPEHFQADFTTTGIVEPLRSDTVESGCRWSTRILSIVPEGTWVQKGDVVCVLDAAEVEDFARSREIRLIRYRAQLESAVQDESLVASDNARRLAAVEFSRDRLLSQREAWESAEFPQQVEKLERNLSIARDRLETQQDEFRLVEERWALGMVPQRMLQQEQFELLKSQQTCDQLERNLAMLVGFDQERREMQLNYAADDAERDVLRTSIRNSLAETRARLSTLSWERRVRIYERYYEVATESAEACVMRAPVDGQVVYATSWYDRSRGRSTIEEGRTVRYRQAVFRIPDQREFQVRAPVSESLVRSVQPGTEVRVRLKGYEKEPISGSIRHVSNYPSVLSSYAEGRRDYLVDIALEPTAEQRALLRPRMDASVTLTVRDLADALTIPRNSLVGIAGLNYVWRWDNGELSPARVTADEASDDRVVIRDGLSADDRILINMSEDHRRRLQEHIALEFLQGRKESSAIDGN